MFYNKSNEGVPYRDGTSNSAKKDDIVFPNTTVLYTWTVPENVAPTEQDPDCLTMVYFSSLNPVNDVYTGIETLCFEYECDFLKVLNTELLPANHPSQTEAHT